MFQLQVYINNPQHPRVLHSTPKYRIVQDKYPKAVGHLLILPTDPRVSREHPRKALGNATFLGEILEMATIAKNIIADQFAGFGYIAETPEAKKKFIRSFIKVGYHSTPSMANLHVHVISTDMFLRYLKTKKHYNSFVTNFFVEITQPAPHIPPQSPQTTCSRACPANGTGPCKGDPVVSAGPDTGAGMVVGGGYGDSAGVSEPLDLDQDISSDDLSNPICTRAGAAGHSRSRTHPHRNVALSAPLVCIYCGLPFGNRFSGLKNHLADEFSAKFRSPH